MSYQTKEEATREGQKWLAAMPKRKGWKLRVWENTGWHFCLQAHPFSIHMCYGRAVRFYTLCSGWHDRVGSGHMSMWRVETTAKTPLASARKALKTFSQIVDDEIANWIAIKEQIAASGVTL